MARDLISRYIWIVDTLNRYGRLSRAALNELWLRSAYSDGNPIPERTFYHYRRAIEENFHIQISCTKSGEYYIEQDTDADHRAVTNWLLDSYAVNTAVKDSVAAAGRISVEEVPSAREYLPLVLDAIGMSQKLVFTYAGFNRSRAEKGIVFRPYFVKRYKQRWYMIGMREKTGDIRTYALDRVKELNLINEHFEIPEEITPAAMFGNIIGITSSKAAVRRVRIRTTPTQAKYFRALPFHASQQEEIHDNYSVFTYKLKLNYELVHELLGYGSEVTVLDPPELRVMIAEELSSMMNQYK